MAISVESLERRKPRLGAGLPLYLTPKQHKITLSSQDLDDKKNSFAQLFDTPRPTHIDIGTGKGRVLIDQPLGGDFNYIGIEKKPSLIKLVAERIVQRQYENVRLFNGFAEEFLAKFVPTDSIDRFSVLFPDPWHKRRHKKRRLISPEILTQLHRTLKNDGVIWLVTDHKEYFSVMVETFDASPLFKIETEDQPPLQLTHFEIKYTQQERPIYRRAYRRVS